MPGASRIIIADGMKDATGDAKAFMASVVADVNAQWARHGVAGVDIVAAEWDGKRDFISIETIPGAQALTVRRVREHIEAERAKVAERWADGARKLL